MRDSKKCPRCGLQKSLDQFAWRDSSHTKVQSYCRACSNKAWVDWYDKEENRRRHLTVLAQRRRRRINRHQKLIAELKSQPCADCGHKYPPYVMDFDHISDKNGLVSGLVYQSGTERLLAEVEKCEVVCANCHRVRTFCKQNGDGSKL